MLCERMCLRNPSIDNLQRLALCHGVYHACKHDSVCIDGPQVAPPFDMQERAHSHARDIRQVIEKGDEDERVRPCSGSCLQHASNLINGSYQNEFLCEFVFCVE